MNAPRAFLAALVLTACSSPKPVLVGPHGEQRWVATSDAVTLIVTANAWPDSAALEDGVMALHLLVINHGTDEVELSPADFELVDRRGFQYDLFDAGAEFYALETTATDGTYGRRYVEPPIVDAPHVFGVFFDDEAAQAALPWGALQPGTQIRGFLYTEIMPHANGGSLIWHATTTDLVIHFDHHFPASIPDRPATDPSGDDVAWFIERDTNDWQVDT